MKKGFTLIELLVVIAIIGVLSSIVLVSMGGARLKARNVSRQADMRQLITAQEMYYSGPDEKYFGDDGPNIPDIPGYLKGPLEKKTGWATYVWVDNNDAITGCIVGEFFCAYATLEDPASQGCTGATPVAYYASSEKGTRLVCGTVAAPPDYDIVANDCVCF